MKKLLVCLTAVLGLPAFADPQFYCIDRYRISDWNDRITYFELNSMNAKIEYWPIGPSFGFPRKGEKKYDIYSGEAYLNYDAKLQQIEVLEISTKKTILLNPIDTTKTFCPENYIGTGIAKAISQNGSAKEMNCYLRSDFALSLNIHSNCINP